MSCTVSIYHVYINMFTLNIGKRIHKMFSNSCLLKCLAITVIIYSVFSYWKYYQISVCSILLHEKPPPADVRYIICENCKHVFRKLFDSILYMCDRSRLGRPKMVCNCDLDAVLIPLPMHPLSDSQT